MNSEIQDYLVAKTGGNCVINVLYPMPGDDWKMARLPPTCVLGRVLVEIFGRFPSTG